MLITPKPSLRDQRGKVATQHPHSYVCEARVFLVAGPLKVYRNVISLRCIERIDLGKQYRCAEINASTCGGSIYPYI